MNSTIVRALASQPNAEIITNNAIENSEHVDNVLDELGRPF